MPVVTVTPPAEEPLTLAEVKLAAKITTSTEDAFVSSRITAARIKYEADTRRQMVAATYDYFLSGFPSKWCNDGVIDLPLPPAVSVTSIKYLDTAGVLQTLDSANWLADTNSEPGGVYPAVGSDWPATRELPRNTVEIRYVAGYADAASVPELDKQAMMLLALHWIENREEVVVGDRVQAVSVPNGYEAIVNNRKIVEVV